MLRAGVGQGAIWRRRLLALLLVLLAPGCSAAPADPEAADASAYVRSVDGVAKFWATIGVLKYVLAGLSSEPSDAALHDAVVVFWAAVGVHATATDKIACYPWEGTYAGHGRPLLCRYSLVFDNNEDGRTTTEFWFRQRQCRPLVPDDPLWRRRHLHRLCQAIAAAPKPHGHFAMTAVPAASGVSSSRRACIPATVSRWAIETRVVPGRRARSNA